MTCLKLVGFRMCHCHAAQEVNGIMEVPRSVHVCQNRASQYDRLGIEYTPQTLRCKMFDVFSFISNGTLTPNKPRNFILKSCREAISNSTRLTYPLKSLEVLLSCLQGHTTGHSA